MRRGYSTQLVFQHYVAGLDELYELAEEVQPDFKEATVDLARATGGTPQLPGLKGRERAKLKAEFKYKVDGGVAWYRLTDVVRATIVYETISDMYRGALAALTQFRGRVREFNDRYMQPLDGGYRDLQFVIAYGDHDYLCELQMSTKLMTDAKRTSGHREYGIHRELVAAVAAGDVDRCETILLWGSELFPSVRQLS